MLALGLLLVGSASSLAGAAGAAELVGRSCRNNCVRGITGGRAGKQPAVATRQADCSSFQLTSVYTDAAGAVVATSVPTSLPWYAVSRCDNDTAAYVEACNCWDITASATTLSGGDATVALTTLPPPTSAPTRSTTPTVTEMCTPSSRGELDPAPTFACSDGYQGQCFCEADGQGAAYCDAAFFGGDYYFPAGGCSTNDQCSAGYACNTQWPACDRTVEMTNCLGPTVTAPSLPPGLSTTRASGYLNSTTVSSFLPSGTAMSTFTGSGFASATQSGISSVTGSGFASPTGRLSSRPPAGTGSSVGSELATGPSRPSSDASLSGSGFASGTRIPSGTVAFASTSGTSPGMPPGTASSVVSSVESGTNLPSNPVRPSRPAPSFDTSMPFATGSLTSPSRPSGTGASFATAPPSATPSFGSGFADGSGYFNSTTSSSTFMAVGTAVTTDVASGFAPGTIVLSGIGRSSDTGASSASGMPLGTASFAGSGSPSGTGVPFRIEPPA